MIERLIQVRRYLYHQHLHAIYQKCSSTPQPCSHLSSSQTSPTDFPNHLNSRPESNYQIAATKTLKCLIVNNSFKERMGSKKELLKDNISSTLSFDVFALFTIVCYGRHLFDIQDTFVLCFLALRVVQLQGISYFQLLHQLLGFAGCARHTTFLYLAMRDVHSFANYPIPAGCAGEHSLFFSLFSFPSLVPGLCPL